jgi:hypothetical protein
MGLPAAGSGDLRRARPPGDPLRFQNRLAENSVGDVEPERARPPRAGSRRICRLL